MANVINTKIINSGNRRSVIYFTLVSDGTQETDTVIYDSSAIAALLKILDPLTSTLYKIYFSTNATDGKLNLYWDATAPILAWALPYQSNDGCFDFSCFGGIKNQAGAGITGDITITTTGLATGESISIILEVGSH